MTFDDTENADQQGRTSRITFDLLRPPVHERIKVRPALMSEIPAVLELGRQHIEGGVSASPEAHAAVARNSHNLYLFRRGETLVGFHAMLMLTACGLERLLHGGFDFARPDPDCLIATDEVPVAIYNWALVAPGLAAEGLRHMGPILTAPQFRCADLYARPITDKVIRLLVRRGFEPLPGSPAELYRYIRLPNRAAGN